MSANANQSVEMTTGTGRHRVLSRWWLKTRATKTGVQLNNGEMPACVELYVPFWAWPLEILHRLVFGSTKIEAVSVEEDRF